MLVYGISAGLACQVSDRLVLLHLKIIQDFQKRGSVTGTLKEGGEIKSVVTQADIDAQSRIVGGLRQIWGDDLRIIGEEDDDEAKPNFSGSDLSTTLLRELGCDVLDDEIPIDDISLFVDPLDGTREFVEGRLQNVACLIGISRKNRPIAGVIGLPFPDGDNDAPVRVHYALADQAGSAGVWPKAEEASTTIAETGIERIKILTGDSNDPVLLNATACAKSLTSNPKHEIVGGTAAKLRIVATEPNCISILHFKTELWDTCSPQALIASRGGKVTDLFGSPLVHSPERPFGNVFGVVASSGGDKVAKLHDELCARMRADNESVKKIFGKFTGPSQDTSAQAMDLARDLNGIPFTVSQVEDQMKLAGHRGKLKAYSVPDGKAWRGMMSQGGRFLLEWEASESELPASLFYKRVVMSDLSHARDKLKNAPHKLIRDVKSYQVETSFLTSNACKSLIKDTGIHINSVYGSDLRPIDEKFGPKALLESRFSVFLEDFSSDRGWTQQWLLDEEATKASLRTFAKFHGYFWTGSRFWSEKGGKLGEELDNCVWENGGYMQPKLQGFDQFENVAKVWEQRYPTFKEQLANIDEISGANLSDLGSRLQEIVAEVGEKAHPFATKDESFQRYRTLIHGDPKQANLFFRRTGGDLEVGLIDFQWSGFGLAATDIAHHLSAAVLPSNLSYDGKKEEELLDYYHQHLMQAFVEYGVAESTEIAERDIFPRSVLQAQYETALLDICRMVSESLRYGQVSSVAQ